jgi:hypothetical protein
VLPVQPSAERELLPLAELERPARDAGNVGAAGQVTARATSQGVVSPIDLVICESDPRTAACTSAPATSVTVEIGAGRTPTFSVFARAAGPIDPASARIFVEFSAGGVVVGRTSVAARTP